MLKPRTHWLATAALLLTAGVSHAGVDADLIFQRLAAPREASLQWESGRTIPLRDDARVMLVRLADPETLRAGEAISAPRQHGDAAPSWILAGEDEKQVALLAAVMEVKAANPTRIGGIGSCSIYTPCQKCAQWAAEQRRRRKLHPTVLRVREVRVGDIQAGQLLMPDLTRTGGTPIVLEGDGVGKAINDIRGLARRSGQSAE